MAVVTRYRDFSEAETASATLRAAGIWNLVADSYTIGLLWTHSIALGWIRLRVRDSDLEAARATLGAAIVIEPPKTEESPEETCPLCGSYDLALVKGSRKTIALWLVTRIVPLWLWRTRLACRGCGASRVVPLRFRPEVLFVMLAAALVAFFALVAVLFVFGSFLERNLLYY